MSPRWHSSADLTGNEIYAALFTQAASVLKRGGLVILE